MVRYPLGGMMSWVLQYLVGFARLGHEVWFVEKADHAHACFDPARGIMTDEPAAGLRAVDALLREVGLDERWCFVDHAGTYHGTNRGEIEAVLRGADVFVAMAPRACWLEEAADAGTRVLVDGDPGFRQMWMTDALDAGEPDYPYDWHFTTGRNVGTEASPAPTAAVHWRPMFHPVVLDLFDDPAGAAGPPADAAFTTVMNWRSYEPLRHAGAMYGHKDVEFERFLDLPRRTSAPLEVAVAGPEAEVERVRAAGWRVRPAHEATASFDRFRDYLLRSLGEFSVCKHAYVSTNSGWFSDRGAAYLASGRPVVQQETGFSSHLPCGEGLFAVREPAEAAAALESVLSDWQRHASAAREIAAEHLAAEHVLGGMLEEVGL
jgi:hypothetical protein